GWYDRMLMEQVHLDRIDLMNGAAACVLGATVLYNDCIELFVCGLRLGIGWAWFHHVRAKSYPPAQPVPRLMTTFDTCDRGKGASVGGFGWVIG
ncbi:MAG: hypothetical protein KDA54_19885, partial [Phycisphaerales bacterium]|nr:hypothetical protein [Phycisphaerales bacterium]